MSDTRGTAVVGMVVVGKISAAYGIKGWVRLHSYTEPEEQIFDYLPWTLIKGRSKQNLKISQSKKHNKSWVVLFDGYDNRNQAEALAGAEVWVDKSLFSELPEGDLYWFQLLGLKVINEADELLGEVFQLLETGANDVLSVKACKDSIDKRERNIPYVEEQVILDVDLQSGTIKVAWDADF
ncbi:MAG: ribosome maturation factor RimM [Pseudomonadales bacterium]|nr:ribosome maturation factor RimM [Pseudomonadales bacterium]